ncbi:MAG: radical SAM protein [Acidobacteria bacterium]|nr:radical SAM protein [Acidobacteriota bacterium]
MTLSPNQTLYPRRLHFEEHGGAHFAIESSGPNWIATNASGARLLRSLDAPITVEAVMRDARGGSAPEDLAAFLADAVQARVLDLAPVAPQRYPGRASVLQPTRLEEFWIQINDFCNLTCEHCLVSSSPAGGHGLPPARVRDAVEQAVALGAEMFGFTGGEPFFRDDLFDLYDVILQDPARSVTTLTNGTRLTGQRLARLKEVASSRLELRISLDGPTAEVNDPIRGSGSFAGAVRGIRNALDTGCGVTVTMAINGANASYADQMPGLLKELGVTRLHVLWPFQRGRAIQPGQDANLTPSVEQVSDGYRRIKAAAKEAGVTFFTYESWKARIDGAPGLKYDLANHCWSSLCLYTNGQVFPSPALTQHPELSLGDLATRSLKDLWLESEVARRFRSTSVTERPQCQDCHYCFLCGGGDMDHAYNSSRMRQSDHGDLLADDPYCDLYKEIMADAMLDWTGPAAVSPGHDETPTLLRQMGHPPNKPPKLLVPGEMWLATIPST